MTQMLSGLVALGLVAKTLLGAVEAAVRRRDSESSELPDSVPPGGGQA